MFKSKAKTTKQGRAKSASKQDVVLAEPQDESKVAADRDVHDEAAVLGLESGQASTSHGPHGFIGLSG